MIEHRTLNITPLRNKKDKNNLDNAYMQLTKTKACLMNVGTVWLNVNVTPQNEHASLFTVS